MGSASSNAAGFANYRTGYPNQMEYPDQDENYRFYSGKDACSTGEKIEDLQASLEQKIDRFDTEPLLLEILFPIREKGERQALQKHEMTEMKASPEIRKRVLCSYQLVLKYFGMKFLNVDTGHIERTEDFGTGYKRLSKNEVHFGTIMRVLKSMGELGLENFKKPFLDHLITEIWGTKALTPCADACIHYWLGLVKDYELRGQLKNDISNISGITFEADFMPSRPQMGAPLLLTYGNYKPAAPSHDSLTAEQIEERKREFREKLESQTRGGSPPLGKHKASQEGYELQRFNDPDLDSSDDAMDAGSGGSDEDQTTRLKRLFAQAVDSSDETDEDSGL